MQEKDNDFVLWRVWEKTRRKQTTIIEALCLKPGDQGQHQQQWCHIGNMLYHAIQIYEYKIVLNKASKQTAEPIYIWTHRTYASRICINLCQFVFLLSLKVQVSPEARMFLHGVRYVIAELRSLWSENRSLGKLIQFFFSGQWPSPLSWEEKVTSIACILPWA